MIELTPKQIDAIHIRMTATCTRLTIRRASPTATVRAVEVESWARGRLIDTVRIQPGGSVQVLP